MKQNLKTIEPKMMTNQVISPVNGSAYCEVALADLTKANQMLVRAQAAQTSWSLLSLGERRKYITAFLDAFKANQPEIAEELTMQMGRPICYTPGEVDGMIGRAEHMLSIAEEALADISFPDEGQDRKFMRREAIGTVLVIAPWNYPYLTAVNVIVPALMAGNAVVLKHSNQTPLCAEQYLKAFQKANLPDGVFQIIHTSHDVTEKMVQDQRVGFVAFTGSVEGGAAMEKAAAGRFIGLGLELGGKDPAYVRSDVDVQWAAENIADGAFFNSGQSCCGIERVYVHADVYDDFIENLVTVTNAYILGDPMQPETTLGPMVRANAADYVRGQIDEAVTQGAKTLIDPDLFEKNQRGSAYMAPQVVVNVTHQMRLMTEESFGPVIGVMKVESDEQAIALMNDSDLGLTASIWTKDTDTGLKIAKKIETGTAFVNRCDFLDPALAWTGVKNTGRGISLSMLGYHQLTQAKSYFIRKV